MRYLWTNGAAQTNPGIGAPDWGWLGYGGDTYDIDSPSDARIGPSLPDGTNLGLQGNAQSSGMPAPPSGGPGTPTTIQGHGCGTSCIADSAKAHLNGGYSINNVVNLYGVSYLNVKGLQIERHSECMRVGPVTATNLGITAWSIASNVATFTTSAATYVPDPNQQFQLTGFTTGSFFNGVTVTVLPGPSSTQFQANFTHANASATETGTASQVCNRSTPYLSDSADSGFQTSNQTTNVLFQDVVVQGMALYGMFGPIGHGIIMERVRLSGEGFAGVEYDDGASTANAQDATFDRDLTINEWAGFIREYPVIDSVPYKYGTDLNIGGFGDAWSAQGTGAGGTTSVLSSTETNSITRYATKDGWGMNHIEFNNQPGRDAMDISTSQYYGNMGQQIKFATSIGATSKIWNNEINGNCERLSAAFPGAPSYYNRYLSLFCRASGINISMGLADTSTTLYAFNSSTGYASPTIFVGTSATQNDGSASAVLTATNNLMLGYAIVGSSSPFPYGFIDEGDWAGSTVRSYNLLKNQQITCPTGNTGEICTSPLLVSQPAAPLSAESQLDAFNYNLTSGSPAIGAGIAISGITTDFAGNTRPSPPSIGALEFGGSPPITTPTTTGTVAITGTGTLQ